MGEDRAPGRDEKGRAGIRFGPLLRRGSIPVGRASMNNASDSILLFKFLAGFFARAGENPGRARVSTRERLRAAVDGSGGRQSDKRENSRSVIERACFINSAISTRGDAERSRGGLRFRMNLPLGDVDAGLPRRMTANLR